MTSTSSAPRLGNSVERERENAAARTRENAGTFSEEAS